MLNVRSLFLTWFLARGSLWLWLWPDGHSLLWCAKPSPLAWQPPSEWETGVGAGASRKTLDWVREGQWRGVGFGVVTSDKDLGDAGAGDTTNHCATDDRVHQSVKSSCRIIRKFEEWLTACQERAEHPNTKVK